MGGDLRNDEGVELRKDNLAGISLSNLKRGVHGEDQNREVEESTKSNEKIGNMMNRV